MFDPRRRGAEALLLCGTALALALLPPRPARAPACCTSATVFGTGRLLLWEDAAAGLRLSPSWSPGHWDSGGGWHAQPDGYLETEGRVELWALLRVSPRIQVHARAPAVLNWRRSAGTGAVGGGLGDVGAGARFEIISIGRYLEIPALALTATVLAPAGTRPEATTSALGVGATGRGAWELGAAAEIEQTWAPWYARLELGGRYGLPFSRADLGVRQRYGPGLAAALSGGRELTPDVVLGGLVSYEREGALSLAGAAVPGSGTSAWSAALALSWRAHPHWSLTGSLGAHAPADGFGRNRPGQVFASAGVRYGHF